MYETAETTTRSGGRLRRMPDMYKTASYLLTERRPGGYFVLHVLINIVTNCAAGYSRIPSRYFALQPLIAQREFWPKNSITSSKNPSVRYQTYLTKVYRGATLLTETSVLNDISPQLLTWRSARKGKEYR